MSGYILSPIHSHDPKSLTDPQVLVSLALIYLSPDTVDNQELRQCLSYFFPAYSYSAPAHQRLMQKASESFDPASRGLTTLRKLGLSTRVRSTGQRVQGNRRRPGDGLTCAGVCDVC